MSLFKKKSLFDRIVDSAIDAVIPKKKPLWEKVLDKALDAGTNFLKELPSILKELDAIMTVSPKKDELLYKNEPRNDTNFEITTYIENPEEKKFAMQMLKEISGTSANIAINATKFTGLLQCNVDPSLLANAADGSGMLRGFCCEGGHISKQALFKEVTFSSQLFSATSAFVILSVITQKYYLHKITKKLEHIERGVSEIINILLEEDRAEIQQSMHTLQRLELNESFDDIDLQEAINERKIVDKIRMKYRNLVLAINIQAEDCIMNKNKAKSIYDQFVQSQFKSKMQIAFGAEMLYFAYGVLLTKIYSVRDGADSSRAKNTARLLDSDFGKFYADKHHEIKVSVVRALHDIDWENSTFGSDEIRKIYSTANEDFKQTEEMFKKGQELLKPVICYEFENGIPIKKRA